MLRRNLNIISDLNKRMFSLGETFINEVLAFQLNDFNERKFYENDILIKQHLKELKDLKLSREERELLEKTEELYSLDTSKISEKLKLTNIIFIKEALSDLTELNKEYSKELTLADCANYVFSLNSREEYIKQFIQEKAKIGNGEFPSFSLSNEYLKEFEGRFH